MKSIHSFRIILPFLLLFSTVSGLRAEPLGTAFTYEGRLGSGGSPANGSYDFRFAVYDAAEHGTQLGSAVTNHATAVSSGLFKVTLDFGVGVFAGDACWLAIAVRPAGSGDFVSLAPRQPLTPTPYALYALTPAGPPGPQGDPGATGATGPQGPQGLRGLTWRGTWSASSNYVADDAVQSAGSAWLAKRANNNATPSESADWSLLAQKGDTGNQGPPRCRRPDRPDRGHRSCRTSRYQRRHGRNWAAGAAGNPRRTGAGGTGWPARICGRLEPCRQQRHGFEYELLGHDRSATARPPREPPGRCAPPHQSVCRHRHGRARRTFGSERHGESHRLSRRRRGSDPARPGEAVGGHGGD